MNLNKNTKWKQYINKYEDKLIFKKILSKYYIMEINEN